MKNNHKLCLNEWAEEDRPREKVLKNGITILSNAELLALLIGSGNTEETAVELMRRVLADCNNSLNELGKKSIDDLCQFKGIGTVKAIILSAASELSKRRKKEEPVERQGITCSKDIFEYFHPLMCDLPHEECWILLLNQSYKIIDRNRISAGGIAETSVDIRCILREALIKRAVSIALCHNHPSGNPFPSTQDDLLTSQLKKAGKLMNIHLIDHVIITDKTYYSYADKGKI